MSYSADSTELPGRISSAGMGTRKYTLTVPEDKRATGETSEENSVENSKYSKEALEEYRQMFSVFDTRNAGSISMEDLKESMIRLGLQVNNKELETLLLEIDQDGNGEIDFDEFCSVMNRFVKRKVTWDEIIKQCFEVFDQHGAGVVSEADFRTILKTVGEIRDDDILDQIFQEVDVDGNGVIDYNEFSSMVRNYMKDDDVESINH